MNPVFKRMMQKKLTEITPDELILHANNYQVSLTKQQANQIIQMMSTPNLDPFNRKELGQLFIDLEQITDQETVKKAKIILNQLIKQYNLADWFY